MYDHVDKTNPDRTIAGAVYKGNKAVKRGVAFADNRPKVKADSTIQQYNLFSQPVQLKSIVMQRRVFTRSQVNAVAEIVLEFMHERMNRETALETLYSYGYSDSDLFEMSLSFKHLYGTEAGKSLEHIVDPNLELESEGTVGDVNSNEELVATGEDLGEGAQEAEEGLNNALHGGFAGEGDEVDDDTAGMLDGDEELPPLDVVQYKRSANTDSGPKTYKTSSGVKVTDIGYTTDAKGSIDFNKGWKQTGNKSKRKQGVYKYNLSGAVDINISTKSGYLPTRGGWRKIASATRAQHFAAANKAHGKSASWKHKGQTWHHLPGKFEMVLVDTRVHSKHGHNGGFLLWK